MTRYFQDKHSKQVASYTRADLIEACLDVTDDKGNIIQESGWREIDKTTFDKLEAHQIEWDISKQKFVDVAPPTKAEIEAQKKATYESEVQSNLQSLGYDKDRQIAILCNKGTSAEHDREFEEMQEARKIAKDQAYDKVYGKEKNNG